MDDDGRSKVVSVTLFGLILGWGFGCYCIHVIVKNVVDASALFVGRAGRMNAEALSSQLKGLEHSLVSLQSEISELKRRIPEPSRYYDPDPALNYDLDD